MAVVTYYRVNSFLFRKNGKNSIEEKWMLVYLMILNDIVGAEWKLVYKGKER